MDSDASGAAARALRVSQVSGALFRRIRAEAREASGLSMSQEWVIALLEDAPEGLSSAELARAQGVRAQTMSTAVAALEKDGLVRGTADPSDGRRRLLHATPQGSEALGRSRRVKQLWLQQVLGNLDGADLRDLDRGLDILARLIAS